MIYFTNTSPDIPHMTFIGRWTPFHKGHAAIITKKVKENPDLPVLIMVRNSPQDSFSPLHRAEIIKQWVITRHLKATIMIVPNIEGVYWGREVGYKHEYVDVDKKLKKISATKIRESLTKGDSKWKSLIAADNSVDIHLENIAHIVDHGLVIWLTGYPCSGKTTITNALAKILKSQYPFIRLQLLDGDVVRSGTFGQNVGFSREDRARHIKRMADLARMFADHGILVICAFISPDRTIRDQVKKNIGTDRFIEVYVKASVKTCMKRDSKGMYAKALQGKIPDFTGVSAPYEPPKKPDVICNTEKISVSESAQKILRYILSNK